MNLAGSTLVNDSIINWVPPPAPGVPENGYGTFVTVEPGTGYFSGIFAPAPPPFESGRQRDVTRDPAEAGAAPLPALALVDVPILVPGYLTAFTAPGYATLEFDLTKILLSAAPVCGLGPHPAGTVCRPDPGSPFTLTQLTEGTAIAFEIRGYFRDTAVRDPGTPDYRGRYTTQVDQSIADILGIIAGGGSINASFSGNFSAIPEPGTVGLALSGLALILAGAIRRRRT
jgi:hypothetical protein